MGVRKGFGLQERRKSNGQRTHEVCLEGKIDANRKCPFSRVHYLDGSPAPPYTCTKHVYFTVILPCKKPAFVSLFSQVTN